MLSLANICTLSTGQLSCSAIFHLMLPMVSLLWACTHSHEHKHIRAVSIHPFKLGKADTSHLSLQNKQSPSRLLFMNITFGFSHRTSTCHLSMLLYCPNRGNVYQIFHLYQPCLQSVKSMCVCVTSARTKKVLSPRSVRVTLPPRWMCLW